MSKLSLDALKERAASTNQEELLNNVSGGTFGACHCGYTPPGEANSSHNWQGVFAAYFHLIFGSADCDIHGL